MSDSNMIERFLPRLLASYSAKSAVRNSSSAEPCSASAIPMLAVAWPKLSLTCLKSSTST